MFSFGRFDKVDHLAIAVYDLDKAVDYYTGVLGYSFKERRQTNGEYSGMKSAVLEGQDFSIVLLASDGRNSQITKFLSNFGPGVQHVAFSVDDIEVVYDELLDKGIEFSTHIIKGPGLRQVFTKRDENSGMMYEFIERCGNKYFDEDNITSLFSQLEQAGQY
ncbi:VOC family protein [Pseudoalteromonas sp. 2CM41L]|uniref:VOC family protein n=1 Tax=Pseudoalteromonas sp. 2CM41L TaxID=2929857 RepID=UPI0020BF8C2A|nr:VOC family protein [Pseudoalteromonas sp. 2CM41L]MCK8108987.1 VOC family protein [Pseudoalteromonas sp. 2CM41L]